MEKIYRSDGAVEWKRYIGGVAVVSQIYNNQGVLQSTKEHYLHHDHLGSLSMITNASGFVVKDFYYDPWGASRAPNNNITQWIAEQPFKMLSSTISSLGFTGHEHLDEVGLIHMNGRIYDAKIARFVQADPIIQDPLRVQSLNRYSYVWNNPLNATDPSGFMTRSQLSGDSDDDWSEDPMDAWQFWLDSQAGEDCSASCRNNLRDNSSGNGALAEIIHNAMNGNISSNSYWSVTGIGVGSTEGLSTVSVKVRIQRVGGGSLGGWGSITGSANFLNPIADACNGDSTCVKAATNQLAEGQIAALGAIVGGEGLILGKLALEMKNAANAQRAADALTVAKGAQITTWKTLSKERKNAVNSFMTQYGNGSNGAKKLLADIQKNGVPKGLDKQAFESYSNQIRSVGGNKVATSTSEVFQARIKILEKILENY